MTGVSEDGRPPYDQDRADSYIGKYVLVGISYEDASGNARPEKQRQLHGRITVADPRKGFCIELEGANAGGTYWLPPDLRAFQDAPPGQYRLRSTGEVVEDPDVTASWTVVEPDVDRTH